VHTVKVTSELAGERADVALQGLLTDITRSQVKRLIEEGCILLDGKPLKPSKRLKIGEILTVKILPSQPLELEPENIPIEVLYEDRDIIVVNKPPGMSVHPGVGRKEGTLVNTLLHHCRGVLSGIGGKLRPGIVHRLDRDTSGVMVIAKNDTAHRSLAEQFKRREVKKRYVALIIGTPKEDRGVFSSSIGRHPTQRIKMSARAGSGREALTLWRVLKRYKGAALVEVEPKTGRTHQIRVHFAEGGHPVLGDRVYGWKRKEAELFPHIGLKRQALHALSLGFIHPKTHEYVEFHASVAEDMEEAIRMLDVREPFG